MLAGPGCDLISMILWSRRRHTRPVANLALLVTLAAGLFVRTGPCHVGNPGEDVGDVSFNYFHLYMVVVFL